jgi:hypothetical protein
MTKLRSLGAPIAPVSFDLGLGNQRTPATEARRESFRFLQAGLDETVQVWTLRHAGGMRGQMHSQRLQPCSMLVQLGRDDLPKPGKKCTSQRHDSRSAQHVVESLGG